MNKDRYLVQKSQRENHWVCTDQENKIVAVWENGLFNESQEIITISTLKNLWNLRKLCVN